MSMLNLYSSAVKTSATCGLCAVHLSRDKSTVFEVAVVLSRDKCTFSVIRVHLSCSHFFKKVRPNLLLVLLRSSPVKTGIMDIVTELTNRGTSALLLLLANDASENDH